MKKFKKIYESNLFLSYDYKEKINDFLSRISNCRIIWGSDKTIENIKKFLLTLCAKIFYFLIDIQFL